MSSRMFVMTLIVPVQMAYSAACAGDGAFGAAANRQFVKHSVRYWPVDDAALKETETNPPQ